jgi:HSP20 family protein
MLPKLRTRTSWPSLIDEFLNDNYMPRFFDWETGQNMPAVNITEGKDDYKIDVAAPGLNKEDFKISLDNNVLSISSEKEVKNESKEENVLRREFSYSSFSRTFTLPETVNGEKIKATHHDGILSIVVPKKDEAKVKPVREIKIS